MENQILLAKEISKSCHEGQVDKSGTVYYLHPLKVSNLCTTPEAKVVALLHDTIEDCGETVESLIQKGIKRELAEIVGLMTHKKKDDYFEYIRKIKNNPIAREVKLADLSHNMDLTRLPHPTEKDFERLEKYKKAKAILEAS